MTAVFWVMKTQQVMCIACWVSKSNIRGLYACRRKAFLKLTLQLYYSVLAIFINMQVIHEFRVNPFTSSRKCTLIFVMYYAYYKLPTPPEIWFHTSDVHTDSFFLLYIKIRSCNLSSIFAKRLIVFEKTVFWYAVALRTCSSNQLVWQH